MQLSKWSQLGIELFFGVFATLLIIFIILFAGYLIYDSIAYFYSMYHKNKWKKIIDKEIKRQEEYHKLNNKI